MRTDKPKQSTVQQATESLDLLPQKEAKRRTDDLLRAMLNSPPSPHNSTPKKRGK